MRGRAYKLVLVSVVQSESRVLHEWLEYHSMLGVEHFYLADHGSWDGTRVVLEPYIAEGLVTYMAAQDSWLDEAGNPRTSQWVQMELIRLLLYEARESAQWVTVIDTDEYISPTNGIDCLREWIIPYEKLGARQIYLYWHQFGPNNHSRIDFERLQLESFTAHNSQLARLGKVIFAMETVHGFGNPHYAEFWKNEAEFSVYADRVRVKPYPYDDQTHEPNSINGEILHFYTRDFDWYFDVKMRRWGKGSGAVNRADEQRRLNAESAVCNSLRLT
jgi:hypothetical protein